MIESSVEGILGPNAAGECSAVRSFPAGSAICAPCRVEKCPGACQPAKGEPPSSIVAGLDRFAADFGEQRDPGHALTCRVGRSRSGTSLAGILLCRSDGAAAEPFFTACS